MISLDLIAKVNQLKALYPCSTERVDSTERHNATVGGAKASRHLVGDAIDLTFDDQENLLPAAKLALSLGFGGIEVDLRNNHLHLDLRPTVWHVVCTPEKTWALADYLTAHSESV